MKYDVGIIGGGPGGYVCAIRLSQLGKKVVLIEKNKLGGECLNYGCIPSKALIFAGGIYDKVKELQKFGIEVEGVRMNVDQLQAFRAGLISKLNQGISFLLKHNKVDVVEGEARFLNTKTIQVRDQTLEADRYVIATGSTSAKLPGFESDGDLILTSKEALELKEIPKKLIVLGGGVIGLELGSYFLKLGAEVTIVELFPQILPGVDSDLVSVLERVVKKKGMAVFTKAKAGEVQKENGVTLKIETDGKEQVLGADRLLVTVGRSAQVETLDLSKCGVKTAKQGFVEVNSDLQTSCKTIYAIGDVIGAPLLAHKASFQGIQLAHHLAEGKKIHTNPIPWAIYTDPEIAGVGLTEMQAKEKNISVKVGKFPFMALGRALAVSETEGYTKVIADAKSHEVLGVFIVGAHASDLISEASLAVTYKLTLEQLTSTIHPHPTLSEGILEAAEACEKRAIHIPNR